MVADLPATYVGITRAARAFRRESRDVQSVLSVLAEGRTKVALEREWRLTVALALKQLPAGVCVLARDPSGCEWYIGPADQAVVHQMREVA